MDDNSNAIASVPDEQAQSARIKAGPWVNRRTKDRGFLVVDFSLVQVTALISTSLTSNAVRPIFPYLPFISINI